MKRITSYLLVVLGIITGNHSLAQRTCGTGDYLQMAIQTDPGLLQQTIDARNLADQWLNMHPDASIKKAGTILKIPVVIHVVYNNTNENISDAQAISQIDVLNEDYRKLNSDTGNVPLWFQPIAADVEVEFILAVRDPDGNSTSGITRTSTNSSSFSTNDNVKFSSSGGKDGWPNSDYLNFWVCDLSGGLLGYATPPGFGSSSTDGVVCDYEYVGATPDNPFNSPFNKGRTATHEVGHYLGLAHTFQGGCAGMSASNCSSGGDRI